MTAPPPDGPDTIGGARRSRRPRLVYFERWTDPVALDVLAGHAEIDLVRLEYASPLEGSMATLRRAHGYQVQPRGELREPWFGDARLLERCPDLLALSSTGAGYDYIDVDACTAAGVIVCHQGGSNREAVAEHALGLMLALSKRIVESDRALRRGHLTDRFELRGQDLRGKTLGIAGLGAIGSRFAELCSGLLGMRVLAFDPYLTPAQVQARSAQPAEWTTLLRESDVISVHCPLSAETRGMFGAAEFDAMRSTALFLNTARGGIHDELALASALREGGLAAAGVDVFVEEPPGSAHPLLQLDTVVATPHIAGITAEALHAMAFAAAEQWVAVFAGEVPPRLVNPEAWPAYADRFERLLGFSPQQLTLGQP